MKYFLATFIIIGGVVFGGITVEAVSGEDVRWDWELGEPAVTADATNACTDTAVARFDWVLGEPTVVFDATANCTAAVAEDADIVQSEFWFD